MATKIEKKSPIQINKFVFFIGVYLLQIGIKRYKTYFLRLKIITDIIFIILWFLQIPVSGKRKAQPVLNYPVSLG